MFHARIRTLILAMLTATCLLVVSCAPKVPIDRDKYSGYVTRFIAHKVPGGPGTVAWSPGGKYLAFLTRNTREVKLYDPVTGETIPISAGHPFFLSWADQDTLLIAHEKDSDSPMLTLLDISSKKTIKYPLPPSTAAVFGEPDAHYAWAFIENYKWRGIGVDTQYALFRPDWKKKSIGEITNMKHITIIRSQDMPYLRGWADVGPDPLRGRTVLLKLGAASENSIYLQLIAVDTITLEATNIMKIKRKKNWLSTRASWSPDGERLALAGDDGHLKVLSLDGTLTTLAGDVLGAYPAWDPRGGQIFFGGYLISDDGSKRTKLVSGKGKDTSTAFFSPSGKRMALDVRGNLWLISGIAPSPRAPKTSPFVLQKKTSALRALYRGGTITREEYLKRLDTLLEGSAKNK